ATPSGDYPVYVARGLLASGFWPPAVGGRRFLVTDGHVGRLYGDALQPLAGRVAIMPGEQSKTVAHAEIVWTELVRSGMTREDVVVALGGGVVGDLAGFCAATYQRGVRYVQVPTTLVAQVDSAYGGKTGVDLEQAKNYVGAYHQPVAVIVACARTKLAVVSRDERDAGLRQVLNLGHTVGHAIEAVTGYARYRHGEAVALGLLAALRLSNQPELRGEVSELLARHGLPTALDGVDPDAVVMATARDKKRLGDRPVPFVLLDSPGAPRPGCAVESRALIEAVRELAP
ncbi:MAG: 3-dehydroquinate synthase, partial [Actinobacteria bacterium]